MDIPNLKIWASANEYQEASMICLNGGLFWPANINAALAVEVYLKSFSAKSESMPFHGSVRQVFHSTNRGHDLCELFSEIDPAIQVLICQESDALANGFNLDSQLTKYKDVFFRARYPYEKGARSGVDTRVVDLASHMREVVLRVAAKTHIGS